MNKPIDAPLGIVAKEPVGPWHVVIARGRLRKHYIWLPKGSYFESDLYDKHGRKLKKKYKRWNFFSATLCKQPAGVNWRCFRLPADLPPGAKLCGHCGRMLAADEGADDGD